MAEKWAIVTGASGGIGLEIAKQLSERDYQLVLVARSKGKLEEVKSQLATIRRAVHVIPLDLSQPGASEELVQQTDKLGIVPEVLVNNAGVGSWGPFLDSTPEEIQSMLHLNMDALVQLSYLYGRKMRERRLGYILQVASTAAFQPLPGYTLYAATKSFVLSFSRALNHESREFGVSSTALCPGPTSTGFFVNAHHKLNKSFSAIMMRPEDVAQHGLEAMFNREEFRVTGLMNKITAILPRIIPSKLVVKGAALFMK